MRYFIILEQRQDSFLLKPCNGCSLSNSPTAHVRCMITYTHTRHAIINAAKQQLRLENNIPDGVTIMESHASIVHKLNASDNNLLHPSSLHYRYIQFNNTNLFTDSLKVSLLEKIKRNLANFHYF